MSPGRRPDLVIPPDGRKTRWEEHRRQRRQELVDAAIATVRERGAPGRLEEIAHAAHARKAIVYRLFEGRDDLYREVCRQVAERLAGAMIEAAGEGDEPELALHAAVRSGLAFLDEDRALADFVTGGGHGAGEAARTGQFVAVLAERLGPCVARLARTRDSTAHNALVRAHLVVAQVLAGAAAAPSDDREELATLLTAMIWSGLAGPPEEPLHP